MPLLDLADLFIIGHDIPERPSSSPDLPKLLPG